MSDLYDFESEADRMEEMYLDDEAGMALSEYVAEAEYKRANTLATLAGLDDDYYTRQRKRRKKRKAEIERKDRLNREKQKDDLFVIIQNSRKDDTTLMLVDRRKSKEYWWTHDFSLAYKGKKKDMENVVKKLRKNNVRVVSYKSYFNRL